MKRNAFFSVASIIIFLSCFAPQAAQAQSDETKKFEVGAQFSSLSLDEGGGTLTKPGFGGRFTYNVTDNFALEAEGNIFPKNELVHAFRSGGWGSEALFGVKIGKRFKRVGIFGKARPGLIRFSQGLTDFNITGPTTDPFSITFRTKPLTHFAADIGGVVELYHSRRIFTRFDLGDTIIRYGQTTITSVVESGGTFTPLPITYPGDTRHNFQFSAGVGFRF
jgi:hypothetical protein